MQLNEKWWCAVEWDAFNEEQRRKTILWLEEHFGKNFGAEVHFGNQFVKPPVREGKPLSSLKSLDEKKLGFYANDMLETMVLILSCWDPAKFFTPYIEQVPMREPCYVGISGTIYHTEKELKEGNEAFRRLFPDLCRVIGEKGFKRVRDTRNTEFEYRVISQISERTEIYDNLAIAQARAMDLAQFGFNLVTGGGKKISQYHNFTGFDWMSSVAVEYPKSIHLDRFKARFVETTYFEKLCNPRQNDEFLEFLKGI